MLGFESEWFYGDPPTFGGVRWGTQQVMFCQQPELAAKVEGLMHMFRVDDIRPMYEKHKAAGALIIDDLENKPWGMSEYVVRDPSGYHLRFAGVQITSGQRRRPTFCPRTFASPCRSHRLKSTCN